MMNLSTWQWLLTANPSMITWRFRPSTRAKERATKYRSSTLRSRRAPSGLSLTVQLESLLPLGHLHALDVPREESGSTSVLTLVQQEMGQGNVNAAKEL